MSYAIYLGGVRLPVNPESFTTEDSRTIKEYDILSVGRVGIAEAKSLQTFKWESEFPRANYSYCTKWQKPSVYLDMIYDHMKSNEPLELTVSNGTSYGVSCQVVITNFERKEVEAGGYEYSIICKEYVAPSTIVENISNFTRPAPTEVTTTKVVNTNNESVYDNLKIVGKDAVITTSDFEDEILPEGLFAKVASGEMSTPNHVNVSSQARIKQYYLANGTWNSNSKAKAADEVLTKAIKSAGTTIASLAKNAGSFISIITKPFKL